MKYEFSIGGCCFCNQGVAEIVKDVTNNELLIMCSECDTIWNSPQDFNSNNPNINKMKTVKKVTDPTLEEIKAKGWEKFIDKT